MLQVRVRWAGLTTSEIDGERKDQKNGAMSGDDVVDSSMLELANGAACDSILKVEK